MSGWGGGWTPTSASTTASGSCSSRRPGRRCSVQFGTKLTTAAPGSAQNLYLVVSDIEAARDALIARGAPVSEVFHAGDAGRTVPARRRGGSCQRARARPRHLRLVCHLHRPGRQPLADAGDHHPAARAHRRPPTTSFASSMIWRARCDGPRPPTASTRSASAQADANWPDWYAAYMVAEQAGADLPT